MSTVNTVTSGSGVTASTTSTAADKAKKMQDDFLKLLVTQMQNQDPMNPLDNAQVTSQMAQLSTVTGINQLNDTVNSLSSSLLASQSLQAANLVGHSVMAPGNALQLSNGAAYGGVDLPQAADKVAVTVKDAAGNVVHSADLGPQSAAGTVPFLWDGTTDSGAKAADGSYTFTVAATQGGKAIAATALSVAQVASVSLGAQGATLNVVGMGPVALSQVKQIL
ncbi:MAG: flagellar hook assembly protein FlgD [Sulfuricella sp.]|jgi:flagellar basal-body rod modification protein FlgD|nr:flagellar hook assembly protein FlgD [Sulfuricella sp.]